jgi:prophage antirepressor-like protein
LESRGKALFCGADVCLALGTANNGDAMASPDEDEKVTIYSGVGQPDRIGSIDTGGRARSMAFVFG